MDIWDLVHSKRCPSAFGESRSYLVDGVGKTGSLYGEKKARSVLNTRSWTPDELKT